VKKILYVKTYPDNTVNYYTDEDHLFHVLWNLKVKGDWSVSELLEHIRLPDAKLVEISDVVEELKDIEKKFPRYEKQLVPHLARTDGRDEGPFSISFPHPLIENEHGNTYETIEQYLDCFDHRVGFVLDSMKRLLSDPAYWSIDGSIAASEQLDEIAVEYFYRPLSKDHLLWIEQKPGRRIRKSKMDDFLSGKMGMFTIPGDN
jgi:hypothetical protein